MTKVLGLALIGAMVAAAVQVITPTGWWLNSGRGVAIAAAVLAVGASGIGVRALTWPVQPSGAMMPSAFWAGANVGMAVMLFRAGPGTIFPIVLVAGAGISAFAVAAGCLVGALLARWLSRRRSG
jgi:hypothetical protein